jgi:SagB-type dehydrogenase family enzyme
MKKLVYIFFVFLFLIVGGILLASLFKGVTPGKSRSETIVEPVQSEVNMETNKIQLPLPEKKGGMTLNEALTLRRSVRSYSEAPLSLPEISQLLWSAQGITNESGFRTAPSAGATFPIEMYLLVNNALELTKGVYHFDPFTNTLDLISSEDLSAPLTRASLSQAMISDASVVLIFGAVFERTGARYGERGERYVYNEIGHASQNVHLQVAAMGLGTVVIGAFRDDEVEKVLNLGEEIRVLYLMPVGKTN